MSEINFPNSFSGVKIEGCFQSGFTTSWPEGEIVLFYSQGVTSLEGNPPLMATATVESFEKTSEINETVCGILRLENLFAVNGDWSGFTSAGLGILPASATGPTYPGWFTSSTGASSEVFCDYPYSWTFQGKTQYWRYNCEIGAWLATSFSGEKPTVGGGTGVQGAQGNQGVQGVQGNQGVQGVQGNQGNQGAQGVEGNTGPTGVQGFQGVQGAQGNQGNDGTSVRFIGSIDDSDLTSGTNETDANSILNYEAQIILAGKGDILKVGDGIINIFDGNLWITTDVEIPDPSPTGVSGSWKNIGEIVGPRGFQGSQGVQGAQGFQGIQGNTGPTGVQGFQGVQGAQGNQGAQGAQGVQGVQGFQGVQGNTGDQGPRGFDGPRGFQGWQGSGVSYYTGTVQTSPESPCNSNRHLVVVGSDSITGTYYICGPLSSELGIANTGDYFQNNNLGKIATNKLYYCYRGGSTPSLFSEVQGRDGSQGNQGRQGLQGLQGLQGNQGFQGLQGLQGNQGFQGNQGNQGITGSISTITVNGASYSNPQTLIINSDHSLTSSSANNALTITFGSFMAMITGDNHTKVSDIARWTYIMQPANYLSGSWTVSGPTFSALNLMESGNTNLKAYGLDVQLGEGITLSGENFAGFSVKRVPTGFTFEVINKSNLYFFAAPNSIDGSC